MKTTSIRVLKETWEVPRGFGAAYQRVIRYQFRKLARGEPGDIIDGIGSLLDMIGYSATLKQIADWPLRKRVEAEVYAANVSARASDCGCPAHPKPDWLPEPWGGPPTGPANSIWGDHGPTEIR